MTDEQIRTIWREMRPMQGDPDPVAFARRVIEPLRQSVAEIIGAPSDWPDHGNVPLAIAATVALLQNRCEQAEGDA